jgi:hypothetical protein
LVPNGSRISWLLTSTVPPAARANAPVPSWFRGVGCPVSSFVTPARVTIE